MSFETPEKNTTRIGKLGNWKIFINEINIHLIYYKSWWNFVNIMCMQHPSAANARCALCAMVLNAEYFISLFQSNAQRDWISGPSESGIGMLFQIILYIVLNAISQ
jgi:hypothetical protein